MSAITFDPQSVRVGDRFQKTSDPLGRAWEVLHTFHAPNGLPHAHLVSQGRYGAHKTIGVPALLDRKFYEPLP